MATAAVLAAGTTLCDVFGTTPGEVAKDITERLINHDFSSLDMKSRKTTFFQLDSVAPSFDESMTYENVQRMDDELKLMMFGVTNQLKKERENGTNLTWKKVQGLFNACPFIEPDGDPVYNTDRLKYSVEGIRFDCSGDGSVQAKVEHWFKKLINDPDILKLTSITPALRNELARMVECSGVTVNVGGDAIDFIGSAVSDSEHVEQEVIDIGVVRYPSQNKPYFKVYYIKLKAVRHSKRVLAVHTSDNYLEGTIDVQKYKPNSETMKMISDKNKEASVKDVNDWFKK